MLPQDVWQIKGKNDGQSAVIFGGVHGDELVGIEVIKKLKKIFDLEDKPSGIYENENVNGNIFLAFGNPQAIAQGTRAAGTGLDMNRMFGLEKLEAEPKKDDQPDLIRARQLAPILAQANVLVDIHCTSSPSAPFMITTKADLDRLQNFSKHTAAEYILIDPNGVYVGFLGLKSNYATDDFVNNSTNGRGVGMCYETGYEKDTSIVGNVFKEMINVLKTAGVLSDKLLSDFNEYLSEQTKEQKIYILEKIILAKENSFKYEPGMNRGWQEVEKGKLVGTYRSGEKVFTEDSGMYLFPKGESKIKEGDSLYYIAKPYDRFEKIS